MLKSVCHVGGKSAFTLVELLVVIAIISLLASILLPAIRSAYDSARQVACMSNERQMYIAHRQYADDFKGYIALMSNIKDPAREAEIVWMDRIALYANLSYYNTGDRDQIIRNNRFDDTKLTHAMIKGSVLFCPCINSATFIEKHGMEFEDFSPGAGKWGYGMTDSLAETFRRTPGLLRTVKNPSQRFMLGDSVDFHFWPSGSGPKAFLDRHTSTGNALYMDGHAAPLAYVDIPEWADRFGVFWEWDPSW